jgi:hypothetical protein
MWTKVYIHLLSSTLFSFPIDLWPELMGIPFLHLFILLT